MNGEAQKATGKKAKKRIFFYFPPPATNHGGTGVTTTGFRTHSGATTNLLVYVLFGTLWERVFLKGVSVTV